MPLPPTEVTAPVDVRKNTVTDWRKDGWPALQKAPYDLDAVESWYNENGKRINRPTPATEDLAEQRIEADIRLKQIKTRLHRYQLAVQTRGDELSKRSAKLG
jgi:phage terminase Nu1 subunit (DNA packaging protein)